jgi:hypothetical protein
MVKSTMRSYCGLSRGRGSYPAGMEGKASVPCLSRDELVRIAQVHLSESLHLPLSFPHPTLLPKAAIPFIIAVTPGLTHLVTSFRDCPRLARDAMMP